MISVRGVNARSGSFRLHEITFDVPQGAYGVMIGPAGSGKTTLLETIAGVVPVQSGRIILGGHDLTSAPPESRRLGIVYQHAYLFPHLTVRANIAYGAVSESVAEEVASRFGVDVLGERSVEVLSGGERQLVAIARTLARRPEVPNAVGHRAAAYSLTVLTPGEGAAAWEVLEPWREATIGRALNFSFEKLTPEEVADAYDDHDRLVELRKRYDPDRRLWANHQL